jgi:hypothetical protein
MLMVSISPTLCYVSNILIVLDANDLCKNFYKIQFWELAG